MISEEVEAEQERGKISGEELVDEVRSRVVVGGG